MKLSTSERLQIETFARDAALRHFRKTNDERTAWQLAQRHWRDQEFVEYGCEIIAIHRAIDEKEASPNN